MYDGLQMVIPIQIDLQLVAKARHIVKLMQSLDDFKAALAVLLPNKVGLTIEATARMIGADMASVNRMQTRLRVARTAASG